MAATLAAPRPGLTTAVAQPQLTMTNMAAPLVHQQHGPTMVVAQPLTTMTRTATVSEQVPPAEDDHHLAPLLLVEM